MRAMIITALLLIVSQASASEQVISVQHDSTRAVTCFITTQGGISCLPDSSLLQQATHSSEAGRASPASSPMENLPQVDTPRPQDERFQL